MCVESVLEFAGRVSWSKHVKVVQLDGLKCAWGGSFMCVLSFVGFLKIVYL